MLTLIMAKAQLIARLAMDIAPSQLSSIIRRPCALPRMLDTIAEEEAVERPRVLYSAKAPLQSWSRTSRASEPGKSSAAHGEQKEAGRPRVD